MRIKALVIGVIIGALPALAMAGPGCSGENHADTCPVGQMLDMNTGNCVDKNTS